MRHGSLFSGIGGFDLAAEWMGWENVFHCEWNEFGQKVLKHHFPNADSYSDITKTDFTKYADTIDIVTGGFPCQPFSLAGKRRGTDDERYLWHEMLRAIQEIKPKFVIAENVFGIVNIDGGLVFEQVCLDLENEGYEVQPFVIPACAKDAPHRRDRCWFIAYSNKCTKGPSRTSGSVESNGGNGHLFEKQRRESTELNNRLHEFSRNATNPNSGRLERTKEIGRDGIDVERESKFGASSNSNCNGLNQCNSNDEINASQGGEYALNDIDQTTMYTNSTMRKGERQFDGSNSRNGIDNFQNFPTQSPICGGDDGLPTELDGITFPKWRNESIKAYGNAIVPQVAFTIFNAICTIS